MKIIFTIIILSINLSWASSGYSQNDRLSVNMKQKSVREVFAKLEKTSGYRFFYNDDFTYLDNLVSVDAEKQTLGQVLDGIFKQTDFKYKILDNKLVVISIKEEFLQVKTKVSGKVTDQNGQPMFGVTVSVKGTQKSILTDASGSFSIDLADKKATLVFSFIGYLTQEHKLTGENAVKIELVPSIKSLDEVVVIGYGTQKKSDLTGSVVSVTSKSYENQPVADMSSALQGRAAGVAISNNSGAPGGEIKIRIRGANSVTGGNDPLYVVDGMQLTSFNLNDINPADVENVEILKDASATAIYGSRGANGVILITSKKGKTEKAKIDFIANYGIANRSYKYNLLSPVAYANQVNLVSPNAYSSEYITNLKNGGGTDWQDAVFQTGKTRDYQLSVSGTTPKSTYYVSGRYLDQTGIVINSNYKKYSFHSNIESKLSSKMTLSAGAFLNRGEGFNNQTTGSLRGGVEQALIWGPAESIYNADGSYKMGDTFGALGPNPVANLMDSYQNNISSSALLNTKFDYKIFDFLTFEILAGMDTKFNENSYINGKYSPYGSLGATRQHSTSMGLLNSNILTFHKKMGKHDLTVTGVYEQSKNTNDYTSASGSGSAFTEGLLYYALGAQKDLSIGSGYGMSRLRSYVGRVNYVFNDKYLLTASYRADGSSKFPNNKWGYFPSVATGWRVSDETFVKDLNIFSNLKIRGGWGVTGNQGASPFATIPMMGMGQYAYGTSGGNSAGISNQIGDPNLKWEQTAQTNIGFDMGFFKNRLSISADYFNKHTKDLLLQVPIPMYWGSGSKLTNVGAVDNKGVELNISVVPIKTNDLTWSVNVNLSSYINKVVELGGGATFINSSITNLTGGGIVTNEFLRNIVGQSMGTFYGNKFLGIYQESEAATAALYGLKPGDNKYLDVNNDHLIDGNDRMIIGHSMPKYSWGFDNTVTFKNFELNVFIMGVNGNDIFNMDYALASIRVGDSRTITNADVTSWTPENKNNQWPKLTSSTSSDIVASSKWLQDGSFIRIKNVSLAYRVPSSLIKGAPLKLSVSAQNLFTFTKYKGYDPEASSGGTNEINQGVVSGAYPSARAFTFSLQLNF